MKALVTEIYVELQGEGLFTGEPSTFIRLNGCNLRCAWCDAPKSQRIGFGEMEMDVIDIVATVKSSNLAHVVITGGEPMIQSKSVAEMCAMLHASEKIVTVETNGTIFDSDVSPSLWVISPKLSNATPDPTSHPTEYRIHSDANELDPRFMRVTGMVQFKFVVSTEEDVDEVVLFARRNKINPRCVLVIPEGKTFPEVVEKAKQLVPVCIKRGLQLCMRNQFLFKS